MRGARIGPLAAMEALPRDGKAVTERRDRDAAWSEVAGEIAKIIRERQALPH